MKDLDSNVQAIFAGIRNAFGVPALLLFSAMTGFGSLAQEQGLALEKAQDLLVEGLG